MKVINIVVIDGEEIEIKNLRDRKAFAEDTNRRVLMERNYVIEKTA